MTQLFKAGDKVSYGDFVGVLKPSEMKDYPIKLTLEEGSISMYFTVDGRGDTWTPVILKMVEPLKVKNTRRFYTYAVYINTDMGKGKYVRLFHTREMLSEDLEDVTGKTVSILKGRTFIRTNTFVDLEVEW